MQNPIDLLIGSLSDKDYRVRQQAAAELGRHNDPRCIPPLLEAVSDESFDVSWEARQSLKKMGGWAVPYYIPALKHPDGRVRDIIFEALQQYDNPQTTAILIRACQQEEDVLLRKQAVRLMEKFGHHEAIPFLIDALDDEDLWQEAVSALEEMNDERIVEPLVRVYLQHPDSWGLGWTVRRLGASTVQPLIAAFPHVGAAARISILQTLRDSKGGRTTGLFMDALGDEDPEVQAEAVEAIGERGDAQAAGVIRGFLDASHPAKLRGNAVKTLGQLKDASAVPALLEMLHDADDDVRRNAVVALGQIGDSAAVEPLIRAMEEPFLENYAIEALSQLGDRRAIGPFIAALNKPYGAWTAKDALAKFGSAAVEPLLDAFQGSEQYLREKIPPILGMLMDTRAVQPLLDALNDHSEMVRGPAAAALGQLGDLRAVEPLIAALNDPNYQMRMDTAEALGNLGDVRAVEPLLAALPQSSWRGRESILRALGKLNDPRAVPALLSALKDDSPDIREAAVAALGQIKDPSILGPLLESLKEHKWRRHLTMSARSESSGHSSSEDESTGVRQRAAVALGKIGSPHAVNDLIQALHDPDDHVRQAAAWALGQIRDPKALPALLSAASRDRDSQEAVQKVLAVSPPIPAQDVRFTAFHPAKAVPDRWYSLLVYAFIEGSLEAVRTDAQRFQQDLGKESWETRMSNPARLTRGVQVTVVPECEGVTFNPKVQTMQWLEDPQRFSFRFYGDPCLAGDSAVGSIAIHIGPLVVATLKFTLFFIRHGAEIDAAPAGTQVSGGIIPPESIFVSYSHKDTPIVLACRETYKALGFDVLIDRENLHSGEHWNEALMKLIDRSTIFQLFWSWNSSGSTFVRQEWEHALTCNKGKGFIRPLYWEKPMPTPPPELDHIHFAYLPVDVSSLVPEEVME